MQTTQQLTYAQQIDRAVSLIETCENLMIDLRVKDSILEWRIPRGDLRKYEELREELRTHGTAIAALIVYG